MREPRTKTITVLADYASKEQQYDAKSWIEWVVEAWNKVPEEYRDTAYVTFGLEDWDDHCRLKLGYDRPETPEEIAEGEQRDAELAARQEKQEKKMLKELLRKHPDVAV